jgi:hypothetical protein
MVLDIKEISADLLCYSSQPYVHSIPHCVKPKHKSSVGACIINNLNSKLHSRVLYSINDVTVIARGCYEEKNESLL